MNRSDRTVTAHTGVVGFDPRRRYKRTSFDYFFVAAASVAALGLLLWAILG